MGSAHKQIKPQLNSCRRLFLLAFYDLGFPFFFHVTLPVAVQFITALVNSSYT